MRRYCGANTAVIRTRADTAIMRRLDRAMTYKRVFVRITASIILP